LCEALLACKRQMVGWAEVIAILVIGRLCEPSSELHVAERWYRTTALEDLLGVSTERIYDERLYRALDRLLPHKEAIEKHLVNRLGALFDLDYDLLLYDVTSTYFEGIADPAIAKRGYSRDHRPDCVQVNIALVVSREGMPLGYEVFAGNTTDVTTVKQIVEGMEERFGKVNRVWVMDRGMVSAENVTLITTALQLYSRDATRGRIMSLYGLLNRGLGPMGAFPMGALATRIGAPITIAVGALLGVGMTVYVTLWSPHLRKAGILGESSTAMKEKQA